MKTLYTIFTLLFFWISFDLIYPKEVNLAQFDSKEVARLDCEMWRSYYEKKPVKLFWQTAELMRNQIHAPFWRSFLIAFHAAKAAFTFKDGKNRTDYVKALPSLEKYYGYINALSNKKFDVKMTARQEIEWWIIRREREKHPPVEWSELQAKVASQLYEKPKEKLSKFAEIRTKAMLFRDEKGEKISEKDWHTILVLLEKSWESLFLSLKS